MSGSDVSTSYGFPPIPGFEWDVRVGNGRLMGFLHRTPRSGRNYTSAVAVELERCGWQVTVHDTGGMPYSRGLGPTLRAAILDSERCRPSGLFSAVTA